MSQHDFNIANQGFPATRADLNNALAALASTSSGTSEPSTTYANQFWYDTTNNLLKFRNAADSAWITFAYLDQATNEWELRSAVIQAVDSAGVVIKTDDGTTRIEIQDDGDVAFDTDTLFVDATNNRVGIGTASPANGKLVVENNGSNLYLKQTTGDYGHIIGQNDADGALTFSRRDGGNTERMRIDASGNFLLGTTDAALYDNTSGDGLCYRSGASLDVTAASDNCLILNRNTTDGGIAEFRKSGSIVGSILTGSGRIALIGNRSGVSAGVDFEADTKAFRACTGTGANSDNTHDIGRPDVRWNDIYATNGTIQTSDANEKQQIASLTAAEMQAAKAISKLFKTFKWNDSVAEKGDAARIHSGVIAQEVEAAMSAAGLDAGKYAFFISTTWWETQTEVPAVEADEENGVEAQEAYTRTDTYDTLEEAPEGATERNRKGIRYPQLLSFIGAATEQRLASIEARLDALELN